MSFLGKIFMETIWIPQMSHRPFLHFRPEKTWIPLPKNPWKFHHFSGGSKPPKRWNFDGIWAFLMDWFHEFAIFLLRLLLLLDRQEDNLIWAKGGKRIAERSSKFHHFGGLGCLHCPNFWWLVLFSATRCRKEELLKCCCFSPIDVAGRNCWNVVVFRR